jgi:hypothetical protein
MNLLPALALATLIFNDDACSARLDQLLADYRHYGLPLPPHDAPLVRGTGRGGPYLKICPVSEADRGEYTRMPVTTVKPDPVAIGKTAYYGRLDFAIQCHERGWRSLARAAFRQWLAHSSIYRAERALAFEAWKYWYYQFADGAPLDRVATHLKRALARVDNTSGQPTARAMLRSLDLSLVPSHSAPGSDDALLDELIEKKQYLRWDVEHTDVYCALARRGFAAVPALIAHLGDDRLTRYGVNGDVNNAGFLRVKDVAYQLIRAFAGEQLEPSNDIAARTRAAGRWFADAQKVGEEKYVVEHVAREEVSRAGAVLFPLLVEKYPKRLPEVYRRLMDAQEGGDYRSEHYAEAVAGAAISPEEQRKVLVYAAKHDDPWHRFAGIKYLYKLDPKRGTELLIAALDRVPVDADTTELRFIEILVEVAEPTAWEALARAAKRAGLKTRFDLLFAVTGDSEPTPESRKYQLAFVASYLNDDALWDAALGSAPLPGTNNASCFAQNEIRNWGALRLARLLGFDDQPNRGWTAEQQTAEQWTAEQWAQYRERVYLALEHALRP